VWDVHGVVLFEDSEWALLRWSRLRNPGEKPVSLHLSIQTDGTLTKIFFRPGVSRIATPAGQGRLSKLTIHTQFSGSSAQARAPTVCDWSGPIWVRIILKHRTDWSALHGRAQVA